MSRNTTLGLMLLLAGATTVWAAETGKFGYVPPDGWSLLKTGLS